MIAPADTDALPPGVATENEALDARLASIRRAFVEKLWSGMLLLATVGVPISVSRAWSTGWLDVYSLQVALGVGVALVYRGRRRLSQGWLSGLLSASARSLGHASRGDGNFLFVVFATTRATPSSALRRAACWPACVQRTPWLESGVTNS